MGESCRVGGGWLDTILEGSEICPNEEVGQGGKAPATGRVAAAVAEMRMEAKDRAGPHREVELEGMVEKVTMLR